VPSRVLELLDDQDVPEPPVPVAPAEQVARIADVELHVEVRERMDLRRPPGERAGDDDQPEALLGAGPRDDLVHHPPVVHGPIVGASQQVKAVSASTDTGSGVVTPVSGPRGAVRRGRFSKSTTSARKPIEVRSSRHPTNRR
jgi:hypothetical protein